MRITDFLAPERIAYSKEIDSKKGALEELSRLMSSVDPAFSCAGIFACLNAREQLGSTGLGNGIAIPHGRHGRIMRPLAAMLRLGQGVDYDAVDQKPVDILFSLLVPVESTDEHLQILSLLAEKFSNHKLLEQLRNSSSPQELYTLITF